MKSSWPICIVGVFLALASASTRAAIYEYLARINHVFEDTEVTAAPPPLPATAETGTIIPREWKYGVVVDESEEWDAIEYFPERGEWVVLGSWYDVPLEPVEYTHKRLELWAFDGTEWSIWGEPFDYTETFYENFYEERIAQVVPEPETYALLGFGLLATLIATRKKRP